MKGKKLFALVMVLVLAVSFAACSGMANANIKNADTEELKSSYPDAHVIVLNSDSAAVDGIAVEESDYTWHVDPSAVHDEVKNAPAEYYTGTKLDTDSAVYIDHELYYYPSLDRNGFKLVNYDGEREYAYYYTDGENDEYIFATLPVLGNSFPSAMMHTEEEAATNKVLHITKAGTYILEGSWKGQVWVDLGDIDDTFADESAKVTLVLNGADIDCSVAPGIVFYSVYECDNEWESRETASYDIDLQNAGARMIIADGTENSVSGANVFRMLKTKYKDDTSTAAVKLQKKMRKTDGALYSYVSLVIDGETEGTGKLDIKSTFEGLDSELHLALNGGVVNITSEDDGINVNEDYVSVAYFNGGEITINASQGAEGDGIDSNGYIVVNGGKVSINNVTAPDSALDSERGVYYSGGTVVIDGKEMTLNSGYQGISVDSGNQGMDGFGGGFPGGMNGGQQMGPGNMGGFGGQDFGKDFDIKEFKKKVAELGDDATLEDVLELLGIDSISGASGGQNGDPGNMGGGFHGGPQGGNGEFPGGNGGFPDGNGGFPGGNGGNNGGFPGDNGGGQGTVPGDNM
ncbi:MAG: carbohydrate-binding domain-containing protein [Firmicutes bacterium]|nr:carbohydrate-binding domain-containing protein [Bacillota bacterium]